ncbi:hypothetical protein T492DRAFT_1063602 [Pavlovales sp. CCMP2436]|nr:hypothetical protein T492DRAFT_1063602 [Pavlovales sp. CCMP2436]
MLKVFLSSFYFNHSGEAGRSDQSLYTVLAYLAILRLEELSFEQFKRLVLSQDFVKTRVFLKFLFNEESLTKWLKEGWLTLYEPHYVQTELIDEVLKFEPQVRDLVDELDRRQAMADAKKAAEVEAAIALSEGRGGMGKHTVPQPFNLTQPAPRLVPEPTELVAIRNEKALEGAAPIKARSWKRPEGPPKDRVELDKKMEQNRVELRKKYADPRAGRFELHAEKRPTNLEALRAEQLAKVEAEHPFHTEPPKPVPKWDADQGFVKLNVAAILREDQVYRRKQAEEAKLLKAYEEDRTDTKAFDSWVSRMRQQEETQARELLERRRAELVLSDELAKAATEASKLEKRALAARMRAEAELVAEEQERAREVEGEERRRQVLAVGEMHRNGALAVAEAERRRHEAAEAVREESKALEAERKRAMAEEDERRQEVIRQIRALELVPRKRERVIDPTYEAGHGLLEEMSLTELRERLAIVAAREVQTRELKRAEIVRGKQEQQQELAGRMATIAAYRQLGAAQAEDERSKAKAERDQKAEAEKRRREEATLKLEVAREGLRAKGREAEAALAAELRQIKLKNQFLGANKEAVEADKFASLESGMRREASALQQNAQDESRRKAQIREREIVQRDKLAAAAARERSDKAANQALRFTNSGFEAKLSNRQTVEKKRDTAAAERANKVAAHEAYAEMYPYIDAIANESRAHAQELRGIKEAQVASSTHSASVGFLSAAASSLRLGNTVQDPQSSQLAGTLSQSSLACGGTTALGLPQIG